MMMIVITVREQESYHDITTQHINLVLDMIEMTLLFKILHIRM